MSVENRKMVYDKLIAEGKLDKISEALKAEFGDPSDTKQTEEPKAEVKEEPNVVPKKRGKR